MQKIIPCLWFDGNGEDALKFYSSIFSNSRVIDRLFWGDTNPSLKGSLLTATFELDGQAFMVLNGGPEYKFTPAISMLVQCETQAEVDYYWDRLLEGGGQPVQCGWLTDRYGVSWQVAPLGDDPDVPGQGFGQRRPRDAGDDEDDQARPRRGTESLRRRVSKSWPYTSRRIAFLRHTSR